MCIYSLIAGGDTCALAKPQTPAYRLKSINATSSLETSRKVLDFSYDSNGRLTEEMVTKVDSCNPNSSYYNYSLKFNYKYSENKLTVMLDGREYSSYNLKNGNIQEKALGYKNGRLESLNYTSLRWIDPLDDEFDKVVFHWKDEDIVAASFYNGHREIGTLSYEYREEKCNSPLVYAYTFIWNPNPSIFWFETWTNHAAMLHCGLPIPDRLIDACRWSTGISTVFTYTFDSDGNPTSMSYNIPKNDFEYFTITELFTWQRQPGGQ